MSVILRMSWEGAYQYEQWAIKGIHMIVKESGQELIANINVNLPATKQQQLPIFILEGKTRRLFSETSTNYTNCPIRLIESLYIAIVMMNDREFPLSWRIEIDQMPQEFRAGRTYQLNILHQQAANPFYTSVTKKVDAVIKKARLLKTPESRLAKRKLYLQHAKQKLRIAKKNLRAAEMDYQVTLNFLRHASDETKVLWSQLATNVAEVFQIALQNVTEQQKHITAFLQHLDSAV